MASETTSFKSFEVNKAAMEGQLQQPQQLRVFLGVQRCPNALSEMSDLSCCDSSAVYPPELKVPSSISFTIVKLSRFGCHPGQQNQKPTLPPRLLSGQLPVWYSEHGLSRGHVHPIFHCGQPVIAAKRAPPTINWRLSADQTKAPTSASLH